MGGEQAPQGHIGAWRLLTRTLDRSRQNNQPTLRAVRHGRLPLFARQNQIGPDS
jgi:hypothetical protein